MLQRLVVNLTKSIKEICLTLYTIIPQNGQTHSFQVLKLEWKLPWEKQLNNHCKFLSLKGALSGLRQFLITESPLKMMKNAFYFTLKALFILKIFKFLSWHFGHVGKTAWLER